MVLDESRQTERGLHARPWPPRVSSSVGVLAIECADVAYLAADL